MGKIPTKLRTGWNWIEHISTGQWLWSIFAPAGFFSSVTAAVFIFLTEQPLTVTLPAAFACGAAIAIIRIGQMIYRNQQATSSELLRGKGEIAPQIYIMNQRLASLEKSINPMLSEFRAAKARDIIQLIENARITKPETTERHTLVNPQALRHLYPIIRDLSVLGIDKNEMDAYVSKAIDSAKANTNFAVFQGNDAEVFQDKTEKKYWCINNAHFDAYISFLRSKGFSNG